MGINAREWRATGYYLQQSNTRGRERSIFDLNLTSDELEQLSNT